MTSWGRAEARDNEVCDTFSPSMLKVFGEMKGNELILV